MATFTVNVVGCLPCCGNVACYLTMPTQDIDGTTTKYADLATAGAALDQNARGAANCIVETFDTTSSTFSAAVISNAVSVHDELSGPAAGGNRKVELAATFDAGAISAAYRADFDTAGQYDLLLTLSYASNGAAANIANFSSAVAATSFSGTVPMTAPVAGCYYLLMFYRASRSIPTPGSFITTVNISAANTWTLAPIRAAYDDGLGGTAYVSC